MNDSATFRLSWSKIAPVYAALSLVIVAFALCLLLYASSQELSTLRTACHTFSGLALMLIPVLTYQAHVFHAMNFEVFEDTLRLKRGLITYVIPLHLIEKVGVRTFTKSFTANPLSMFGFYSVEGKSVSGPSTVDQKNIYIFSCSGVGRDLFYVETNDAVFGLDVTDEVAFSASLGEYGSSRSRQQDRGLTIEHSYHHIVKLFTDYIWWYLVALSILLTGLMWIFVGLRVDSIPTYLEGAFPLSSPEPRFIELWDSRLLFQIPEMISWFVVSSVCLGFLCHFGNNLVGRGLVLLANIWPLLGIFLTESAIRIYS